MRPSNLSDLGAEIIMIAAGITRAPED